MQSGVRGEVTEHDELLSRMPEAQEEEATQTVKAREEINPRDERKLAAGERLVANERACAISIGIEEDEVADETSTTPQSRYALQKVNHADKFKGEVERFRAMLREADSAKRSADRV